MVITLRIIPRRDVSVVFFGPWWSFCESHSRARNLGFSGEVLTFQNSQKKHHPNGCRSHHPSPASPTSTRWFIQIMTFWFTKKWKSRGHKKATKKVTTKKSPFTYEVERLEWLEAKKNRFIWPHHNISPGLPPPSKKRFFPKFDD